MLEVINRIFQRAPLLVEDLEDQVEEEGGGTAARKRRLIEVTVDKVWMCL